MEKQIMAKHRKVLIGWDDFMDRVCRDSDNFGLADALAFDGTNEEAEAHFRGQLIACSWPEHVLTPRYNADGNYAATGCKRESELPAGEYDDYARYGA